MGFKPSTFPRLVKNLAFFGAKHATYAATGSTSLCLLIANAYKLRYR